MKVIRMQQKYDTEANWVSEDPLILPGEIVVSIDTDPISYKIGKSGTNNWSDLEYIQSSGASDTYTNSNSITTPLGGIEAGETFNDVSLTTMWDKLLYPYLFPSFNTFTSSDFLTNNEVGKIYTAGPKNFTWNTVNDVNAKDNYVTFNGSGLDNPVTSLDKDYDSIISLDDNLFKNSPGTCSWTITGENTRDETYTRNLSIYWKYQLIWGNSAKETMTMSDIIPGGTGGLDESHNKLTTNRANTIVFTQEILKYKYILCPVGLGELTSFTDLANIPISMELPYLISHTNSFGVTYNMRVHRTQNKLGGNVTIKIA